jgi:hypothetical protein
MTPNGTSRRAFLEAVVLGGSLVAASLAATPVLRGTTEAWRLAAREPVLRFGRRYLDLVPHEADRRLLIGRLHDAMASSSDRSSSIRAFTAACATDLAAGRIVVLDGWVMPVTEARVCALVALSRRAGA